MSKEGERHVAELIRLEGKRKELEDSLGRVNGGVKTDHAAA